MRTEAITIDREFAERHRPLKKEERELLESSIVAEGCREALVVWRHEGKLLLVDGHNRYEICTEHGRDFETCEHEFSSRDDALLWIINNQLARRNLEPIDKVPLAEAKREILERQAKERKKRKPADFVPQNSAGQTSGEVRQQLADEVGVSHETYDALKTVVEQGTPELVEAVRSKQVGASTAAEVAASYPKDEQKKILDAAAESGESVKSAVVKAAKAVHVSQNTGMPEWYTPPIYLDAAREVLGEFDLDPASSEIAQKQVRAKKFYTAEQNGLLKKWKGSVWMNPPYTSGLVEEFIGKICEHHELGEVTEAIVLVNNATDTKWFQRGARAAAAICFASGRIKFLDPEGNAGAPLQGQAFIYFGENAQKFVDVFQEFGFCTEVCA